jgi:ATP-dependent Clp protease ATP-binding subunit ClpB
VDFKNVLIIMTSNIGTSYISDASIPMDERRKGIEQELKMNFKPEFLNRLDEIIIFNPLTREHIKDIVKLQLNITGKMLKEQRGIKLEMTKKALEFLVNEGFDQQFGARPLKRAIQKHLLNPLSIKLLGESMTGEQVIKVDSAGKSLIFS